MSFCWQYNLNRVTHLETETYKAVMNSIFGKITGLYFSNRIDFSSERLRYECRSLSADVRQIFLSDGGLFNRVILSPKLHPLGGKSFLSGDISRSQIFACLDKNPSPPFHLVPRGVTSGSNLRKGACLCREENIDPLLGVHHDAKNQRSSILFDKIFDLSAPGIPLKKWLKCEMVCVSEYHYDTSIPWVPGERLRYGKRYGNRRCYTMRDLISFVANKDGGVHVSRKDTDLMKDMRVASFGSLSYAHIVILCLSVYLLKQHVVSQEHSPCYQRFLGLPGLKGFLDLPKPKGYQSAIIAGISFHNPPTVGMSDNAWRRFETGLFRVEQPAVK